MVKIRSRLAGRFRAVAAFALLAVSPWTTAQSIFGMSPEDEKRIGREEHPRILEHFGGAYDDRNLARYIDSIGQFIAAASNAPEVGYTFTVIDSPIVNAFAVPGGYVYLTRGLLALADNEAEVAGVLAHEIAHVTARHGAKRQSKGTLAGLGLAVLGAVTDNDVLKSLGRVGAQAVLSTYSRKEEYEADDLGVLYLSRAGFDPGAMSSFLDKLKRHSALEASMHGRPAAPGLDFFATHPRTRDRVERAVAGARRTSVADPIVGRNIYLSKIDGLLFGDGPERGFVRGHRFVHPSIGFEFEAPPGFRLLNGERAVTGFGSDGAKMYFDMERTERGRSLDQFLHRDWAAGMRLRRYQRTSVDGMDAVTAVTRGSDGQPVRLAAIRFRGDEVARFVFVPAGAPRSEIDRRQRTSVFSFRRLSQVEARSVKPWHIAVREVGPGETVDRLVARHFPTGLRMPRRTFRVLNGLPRGEPRAGDRAKLIIE